MLPSPNRQAQVVGLPSASVLASVNWQVRSSQVQPKSAVGARLSAGLASAENEALGGLPPAATTLASPVWTPTLSPSCTWASARPSALVRAVEGVIPAPSPAESQDEFHGCPFQRVAAGVGHLDDDGRRERRSHRPPLTIPVHHLDGGGSTPVVRKAQVPTSTGGNQTSYDQRV